MRNRFVGFMIGLAAMMAFLPAIFAQTEGQSGAAKAQATPATPDVSGVWYRVPVEDYYAITTLPIMRP